MVSENFYNKNNLKRLNMYVSGKPKRDSKGNIVKDAIFQSTKKCTGRIQPLKNWFTSTKLIEHNELDDLRKSINVKTPYQLMLKSGNVPGSLIHNTIKQKRENNIEYSTDFSANNKKFKNTFCSLEEMVAAKKEVTEKFEERKKEAIQQHQLLFPGENSKTVSTKFINKGNGRMTFNELYKVLDTSDIVVHVMDVRNPRICKHIENYMEKNKHKYLVYLLNKVDLVPTSVLEEWMKHLGKEHPVVAFHSYFTKDVYNSAFGKGNLLKILRQLKRLFLKNDKTKPCVSVGFVGYPNTGKSTIINSLIGKNVCSAAPVPGQTKHWQMVALYKNLYLIDSPGVIPFVAEDPGLPAILDGGVRVENLPDADVYIDEVVKLVSQETLCKIYNLPREFKNSDEFIEALGRRQGMLLKGGIVNIELVAKKILYDLIKGRIPFYKLPPKIISK